MTASVYERVLGAEAERLDPVVRRYVRALPPDVIGHGEGVYEVAGSRCRALAPLLRLLAWRRVLFPEWGRDVPFTIENRATATGGLRAVRNFHFPGATRLMCDEIHVAGDLLVDRLGRRGGLEVMLVARVEGAALRLDSCALAVRVGPVRIPLPPIARVRVAERADDVDPRRQRVDVRVRAWALGEVFRYTGVFTYDARSPHPSPGGDPGRPSDVGGRP